MTLYDDRRRNRHAAGACDCRPVFGNLTELQQIIFNLCTNSYHSMRERIGKLRISLQEVVIKPGDELANTEVEPGDFVKLTVKDNGHGMDEKALEHIFEPFYTTKEPEEGTGLGLSTVYGIVKNHRGGVKVSSQLGKGTKVDVYLPVCMNEPQRVKPREAKTVSSGENRRILFVDDEESICLLVKTQLTSLGFRVDTCTSSLTALEVFQSDPRHYDILITDQAMPEMTGVQLAEKISKIKPQFPVILISGFQDGFNKDKVTALGIREILMKPFEGKDLGNAVQRVLGADKSVEV